MTKRLLLSYLTVTAVVLLMLEIPLGIIFRDLEIDRLTAAVERDAATLATLVEEDVEGSVPVDEAAAQDYAASTGARVVVTDGSGISLVDTDAPTSARLLHPPRGGCGARREAVQRQAALGDAGRRSAVRGCAGGLGGGGVRRSADHARHT